MRMHSVVVLCNNPLRYLNQLLNIKYITVPVKTETIGCNISHIVMCQNKTE